MCVRFCETTECETFCQWYRPFTLQFVEFPLGQFATKRRHMPNVNNADNEMFRYCAQTRLPCKAQKYNLSHSFCSLKAIDFINNFKPFSTLPFPVDMTIFPSCHAYVNTHRLFHTTHQFEMKGRKVLSMRITFPRYVYRVTRWK